MQQQQKQEERNQEQSKMNSCSSSNDINYDKFIEEPWSIIDSYFRGHHLDRLVRHQLESYDNMTNYQLEKTINMYNPKKIVSEEDLDPVTGLYALEIECTFSNFHLYRPQIHENNGATKIMFPQEARLRSFTYNSVMTIDITFKYTVRGGDQLQHVQTFEKTFQKIHIGKLPIMVKSSNCVLSQYKHVDDIQSGECKMDAGGYFIMNGSEKTVLGQERPAENRVYCFNVSKNNTKYSHTAEMRSIPDTKCISPKQISMMLSSKNSEKGFTISIQIPRIKNPVPLFVVFRALGVLSDKEICDRILIDIDESQVEQMLEGIKPSVCESDKCTTQEEALRLMTSNASYSPNHVDKEIGAKKKREFAMDILKNDLFPHCTTQEQKLFMLGYMANKLLQTSFGWIKTDDRDSFTNKRIDTTGSLINNLFRSHFGKMVKDMEKLVIKEIKTGSWRSTEDYVNIVNLTNINKIVKPTTIESGINRALNTGDFGVKPNSNKVGVAQLLNRNTYPSSLSHLRRVSTPSDKNGKIIEPRKLHSTTWGFMCPAETPEGASVGLVKNLSIMSHITIYSHSATIYEYVAPLVIPIGELFTSHRGCPKDYVKVFVNGTCVGFTYTPSEIYENLKNKKNMGIINIYASIVFDCRRKEIRVCTDCGRMSRPLLRVKNNRLLITREIVDRVHNGDLNWDDLFTGCKIGEAVLEYIDPEEQSHSLIATTPSELLTAKEELKRYTHCEIHPSTIFGVLASCIPFPEHNQSPRNTYQCAMQKQAMGMYVTNFKERMDKTAYVLNNPTRPLVDTRITNMIKLNQVPSGCNITVAIMTHTGYNQEDSLLINKGSIDRGLFQATVYHTEKDEDKQKINGDEEIRCKPDPTKTKGMRFGNYNKVNSKGLVPENTLVENRDVIIAKVTPIKDNRNDHTKVIKFEDQSKMYRTNEPTYIDRNYMDRNGNGYSFAKVRVRAVRKPVIGDKFSSRHGQKGTCGNIIPEEDMPYTRSGLRPDIIINPHAIPSRMTIGQLKEMLLGKVLVELGLFGDGTSFGDLDVNTISQKLFELGFESHCNEVMYDGLTGEQMESDIFMGPVFYQRLKHMVIDKQHSRSVGAMVNLTRQPPEGRSRDGGLKFGQMEKDCKSEGTPVSLSSGISVKIDHMQQCDNIVLGWCPVKNGMKPSRQIGFMHKGERECLRITYADGRKVECTPDHPLLTSTNEWIRCKDLVVGSSFVKASITCPLVDMSAEIQECAGWSMQVGNIILKTNNKREYLRSLSFVRIVGYLIMDGGIYRSSKNRHQGVISLGHMIDVASCIDDLNSFCEITQEKFKVKNYYCVRLPTSFVDQLIQLKGLQIGAKIGQPSQLPDFVTDPNCPRPIVREFIAAVYGADGHTCCLSLHRGKRDLLTSIGFSKTKPTEHLESLNNMMQTMQRLLAKCGITKTTIQPARQTSGSKKKADVNSQNFQINLHIDISELVLFSEKVGFRYCCHKSQRLEAGVSYKRLREETTRQHNEIVARVDELTGFSQIKAEFPDKIVHTKKAIVQATEELKTREALVHEYAIPSTHDITNHLVKGTVFGKFAFGAFPTAEEFMAEMGTLDWFLTEPPTFDQESEGEGENEFKEQKENEEDAEISGYGVNREDEVLPTMNLKVIDIRPIGLKQVYDIEVEETHSFLANGVVSHNCMVSHGASRFTRGRMYDASDKFQVHICKKCGMIAAYNDAQHIHICHTCENKTDFAYVEIPYAYKLLSQELITMNVAMRVITDH
jgi:DNA-directed RNA polymerase II subunit RPB2